jgi:hypothetical protein
MAGLRSTHDLGVQLTTISIGRLAGVLVLLVATGAAAADPSTGGDRPPAAARDRAAEPSGEARESPSGRAAWNDWRSYRISVTGGFGVTFDHVDSRYVGAMRHLSGGSLDCLFPEDTLPNRNNCIRLSGEQGGFVSGGAFNVGGRLTLHEFDVPTRPRVFLNASLALQQQGSQTLAHEGLPSDLWRNATDTLGGIGRDPFLYIAQTFDPRSVLFAGLGSSFVLLPLEDHPVRLNGTISYFRSKGDASARFDFTNNPVSSSPLGDPDLFVAEEVIVHGIAPGVGLDVEVASNSLFEVGLYADFFVGFPLSDNAFRTTLTNGIPVANPGPEEQVEFRFDRDVNYSLFLGIRLGLVRD